MTAPATVIPRVVANLEQVMSGQAGTLRKILAAFLAGGHVLLEDNPGTGKTTGVRGQSVRRTEKPASALPVDPPEPTPLSNLAIPVAR